MIVTGLTGGMCCGKSTVSSMLTELGCCIIDADQISRRLVEPGMPALKRITRFFGDTILNKDGTLDRRKLAGIIYHDSEKRKILNSILHPMIIKEEERLVRDAVRANKHQITIVSAALMIETGHYKRFPKIIVVYCSKEKQIERIMKREHCTRKEALQRIQAQLTSREKKNYADYSINTSGPYPQTRRQVVHLYQKLRKFTETKPRKH